MQLNLTFFFLKKKKKEKKKRGGHHSLRFSMKRSMYKYNILDLDYHMHRQYDGKGCFDTCLFDCRELHHQIVRNGPVKYVEVLFDPSFVGTLGKYTLAHL